MGGGGARPLSRPPPGVPKPSPPQVTACEVWKVGSRFPLRGKTPALGFLPQGGFLTATQGHLGPVGLGAPRPSHSSHRPHRPGGRRSLCPRQFQWPVPARDSEEQGSEARAARRAEGRLGGHTLGQGLWAVALRARHLAVPPVQDRALFTCRVKEKENRRSGQHPPHPHAQGPSQLPLPTPGLGSAPWARLCPRARLRPAPGSTLPRPRAPHSKSSTAGPGRGSSCPAGLWAAPASGSAPGHSGGTAPLPPWG